MNNPFNDLSKLQMNKLFDLLEAHMYKFNKNEEILPTIKNENIVGIIMEGSAQIVYIEYNGNEIVVENLNKDSIFGSNISATNHENCQIIAKETTEVLVIDYKKLFKSSNTQHNYFNIFLFNLLDIINIKFKEQNDRMRVLEKKQIREKLLEYFEIQHKKSRLKNIYLPFSFKDLADYIAVNRSAMFRELKNMKDEQLIKINDRKITLLYKNN